ncbi:phenylacetate--CoA ligase family protein [soil metagenome]
MIKDRIYKTFFLRNRYSKLGDDPLKFLISSDFWSREEIESYTLKSLKSLTRDAKANTVYYANSLKSFDELNASLEDFKKLEVLTKNMLRNNPGLFRSNMDTKVVKASSSGSTGEPMTIYRSILADAYILASHYRFHSWYGINPNARHVIIWGTGIVPEPERNFIKRVVKDNLVNTPLVINVFDLNSVTIGNYKKLIEEYKPEFIRGYTSSVKQLCTLLDGKKLKLNLKAAIVTSEISLPEDKKFISEALNCRTLEEYGSRDGGQYAYECPEGSLHVQEELTFLITDNNNEVISTELHNKAMPMINYMPGDKVILGKACICGRSSRTIESIEGRVSDVILKEDGSSVSSWIIYYMLKDLEASGFNGSVSQLQLIQNRNNFNVIIVKGKDYKDPEQFIINYLKARIGNNVKIEFEYLIEIPKEKSGKIKLFKHIN